MLFGSSVPKVHTHTLTGLLGGRALPRMSSSQVWLLGSLVCAIVYDVGVWGLFGKHASTIARRLDIRVMNGKYMDAMYDVVSWGPRCAVCCTCCFNSVLLFPSCRCSHPWWC